MTARLRTLIGMGIGGLLAAGPGCARSDGPSGAAAPAPAWSWAAYPVSQELLVGQYTASVSAVRTEVVRAPVSGRLHFEEASRRSGVLEKGCAWGSIEPEDAAATRRSVDEEQREVLTEQAEYLRDGLPAELQRLDREIADSREALGLARFAESSPGLFEGDTPALDPHLRPRESAAQVQAHLGVLVERRRLVAARDPAAEPAALRAARLDLERRLALQRDRLLQTTLAMPFAGSLRLARSPDEEGARVEAGEILATVSDESAYEVRIRSRQPLLFAVDPSTLTCAVTGPGGSEVTGAFSSLGLEADSGAPVPVFRFRLPAGSVASWQALAGTELAALVRTRLPVEARVVPKLDLVLEDRAGALAAGWSRGVGLLFPGSRLLAVGRDEVALVPPPSPAAPPP